VTQSRNPQAEQMADESMARNLSLQARAIWPQEQPLFARYALRGEIRIVDVGCGTGEITRRLAEHYPQAQVLGLDVLESNLVLARRDNAGADQRISYQVGDAFALALADASVDLVVCRHMSQSVPDFPLVLAEFSRVLRPGGWLHLLSEDYGMLHMPSSAAFDSDRFWNQHVIPYMRSIGCDAHIGRHSPVLLEQAGYQQIAMDYLTIDTLRVERAVFAGIIESWRDGYATVLAEASARSIAEVRADMERMIDAIATPPQYAVWHVPVISGRRP
jgi:ubiquinone/menaquinone biosynthesis C-methylase UbiE